jgi:GPH family glycoside/pentoside/hexuronide:cation symporter
LSSNQSGLSFKRKLGYASGIVSESVLYNMFYTFFIIFLTDTVGLRPVLAGTIALFSVAWDGFTDPMVGYYLDRSGRDKRRVIARAAIPMALLFIAAFVRLPFSQGLSFAYYLLVTMAFWLAYTLVTVPYYALTAEMTQDYDERTNIRGMSSFINTFAILIGAGAPPLLVELMSSGGIAESSGWVITAGMMGFIAIIFVGISLRSLRRVNLRKENALEGESIFKTYADIIRMKPMASYLAFVFFFLISSTMITGNLPYLIEYRALADPESLTIVLITTVGSMMAFVPVMTWISSKRDRKSSVIFAFATAIFGLVLTKILGADSLGKVVMMGVFVGVGLSGFWTMFYTFAYDLCELDEFAFGHRREGAITALPQLVQKIGSALGLWLVGFFLEIRDYDPSLVMQSESTRMSIENLSTLVAAGFMLCALLAAMFYPVSKERFILLQERLELKRNGSEVSSEGLESLLN